MYNPTILEMRSLMKAFLSHMERESEKETTRRRMARVKGMLSSLDKVMQLLLPSETK